METTVIPGKHVATDFTRALPGRGRSGALTAA